MSHDRLPRPIARSRTQLVVAALLAALVAAMPAVHADPNDERSAFPPSHWTHGQTRAFDVIQQGVNVGTIYTRFEVDWGEIGEEIVKVDAELEQLEKAAKEAEARAAETSALIAAHEAEIAALNEELQQLAMDPDRSQERMNEITLQIAELSERQAKLSEDSAMLAARVAELAQHRALTEEERFKLLAQADPIYTLVTKTEMGMAGQRMRGQSITTYRVDATPATYRLFTEGVVIDFEFGEGAITVTSPRGTQVVPNMPRLAMLENNNIVMLEAIIASVGLPEVGESAKTTMRNPMTLQSSLYSFKHESIDEDGVSMLSDNFGEEITWVDGKGITHVELAAANVAFEASDAEWPDWDLRDVAPLEYTLPANATFSEVEVTVERKTYEEQGKGGFTLAGTLNTPNADVHGEGPYPAVFLQSGSGSQDRHGFAGEIDAGSWETLDAIADAGFVVLRVDDRGTGGSEIGPPGADPRNVGAHELCGDTRSCVEFLMARPEVDKSRVFVLGHSEGGLIVAMFAALPGIDLAGIVSLAGVGRNFSEVIFDQVRDALQALPPGDREARLRAQRELMDAVREGRDPDPEIVDAEIWNESKSMHYWMRSHFRLNVPEIHAAIEEPVLLLQGVEDIQVHYVRDARTFAKNLIDGGNLDVTLRTFPDLDHLFKPCGGQPSTLEMYKDRTRRVDPTMLKVLVNWLELRAE